MLQCPPGSQPVRVKISMLPVMASGVAKAVSSTLYYLNSGPGVSTMAAFKTALEAQVAGTWTLALSVKYLAPTITIRDLTQYYNPDVIYLPAANGAWDGSVAGDVLPWQAAANFTKRTAQSGKINRGQLFLAGVPESGQDSGILTGGQQTLYQNLVTDLIATFAAGGNNFVPQLFSPTLSNLKLGVAGGGVWMMPLTDLELDSIVSGLKRRKPKSVPV